MTLYLIYHLEEDNVIKVTNDEKEALAFIGDLYLKDVSLESQVRLIEIPHAMIEEVPEDIEWVWYGEDDKLYRFTVNEDAKPDITDYVLFRNNIYLPFASNSMLGTLDIRRVDTDESHRGVSENDLLVISEITISEVE